MRSGTTAVIASVPADRGCSAPTTASRMRCTRRWCCASTPTAHASLTPHAGTWRPCSRIPPCRSDCARRAPRPGPSPPTKSAERPLMRPPGFYAPLLVCVLAVGSLPLAPAAAGAPFTVEDLVVLKRVGDPQVSPDGRHVAYVQRETDLQADKAHTSLWLLDRTRPGSAPLRLTDGKANDSSPRWASDSRALYFLSERSGRSQVWRGGARFGAARGGAAATPAGGCGSAAARRATDYPLEVGSLKVSPRGDMLALSMAVFPDCSGLACTRDRLDAKEKDKASGRIYDRMFVRHWDSWSDGTRSHLFSARLGADGAAGVPIDVSKGFDADIPRKPFGGDEDYAFSPD